MKDIVYSDVAFQDANKDVAVAFSKNSPVLEERVNEAITEILNKVEVP